MLLRPFSNQLFFQKTDIGFVYIGSQQSVVAILETHRFLNPAMIHHSKQGIDLLLGFEDNSDWLEFFLSLNFHKLVGDLNDQNNALGIVNRRAAWIMKQNLICRTLCITLHYGSDIAMGAQLGCCSDGDFHLVFWLLS